MSRRHTSGKVVTIAAVMVVGVILWSALVAVLSWALMLAIGVLHSVFPMVPAVGFKGSVAIMFFITVLGTIRAAFFSNPSRPE